MGKVPFTKVPLGKVAFGSRGRVSLRKGKRMPVPFGKGMPCERAEASPTVVKAKIPIEESILMMLLNSWFFF